MSGSQRERDTLESYKAKRPRFGEWQWVKIKESELFELKPGFITRPLLQEDDMIELHIRNGYCPCNECPTGPHEYMFECENTDIDREDGTTENCCHNICT